MANTSDPLFKRQGSSRAGLIRKAERVRLPSRTMVSGEPSAGKTQTSLDMANAIARRWAALSGNPIGNVTVVDTEIANGDGEQGVSQNFAATREFQIIPFSEPHHPLDLVATLDDIATTQTASDVVVIDNATVFWRGAQGILGLVGENDRKTFNRWNPAREIQTKLVRRIQTMPGHVIITCRAKDKHVRTDDDNGVTISNEGLVPIQDADLPYEMTIALMMDRATHGFKVEKLNAPIEGLHNSVYGGNELEGFVETYIDWLYQAECDLVGPGVATKIRDLFEQVQDKDERTALKHRFVEVYKGFPESLRADQGDGAVAWVTAQVAASMDGIAPEGFDADPNDEIGLGALVTQPLQTAEATTAPVALVPPTAPPAPAPVTPAEAEQMTASQFFEADAPPTTDIQLAG